MPSMQVLWQCSGAVEQLSPGSQDVPRCLNAVTMKAKQSPHPALWQLIEQQNEAGRTLAVQTPHTDCKGTRERVDQGRGAQGTLSFSCQS